MPLGEATVGRRDEDSLGLEQEVAVHPGQQLQFSRSQTGGEQLPLLQNPNILLSSFL